MANIIKILEEKREMSLCFQTKCTFKDKRLGCASCVVVSYQCDAFIRVTQYKQDYNLAHLLCMENCTNLMMTHDLIFTLYSMFILSGKHSVFKQLSCQ